jgi:site-specific recombinase XerD
VIPVVPVALCGSIDFIQRDYGNFLLQQRGLVQASVTQYLRIVRCFLSNRFAEAETRLNKLCARDVSEFVLHHTSTRGRRAAQLMTTVLRSFLSFLFQEGRTPTNLAMAVPTVAGWRQSELPHYLEAPQVEKLLRFCDRQRAGGKRDYAILLLLARLGLRAGEVACLSLDDIDWSTAELRIRGKGGRVDRMPLLQDVGQAIVDYVQNERPTCLCRRVFIRCRAPYVGFATQTVVSRVVSKALVRSGIHSAHRGAHLLRHSLATRMLRNGASLAQIGRVLRHQQIGTTEVYAKVDLNALRALGQPWPGGVK